MDKEIARQYGNRVRVRACGICLRENSVLMVNHGGITSGDFWMPPGGGIEFGSSIEDTLKREFIEETGLEIEPGGFLFGCEYIQHPLHAIELFYLVSISGGALKSGQDPELQIIRDARFLTFEEIVTRPAVEVHAMFRHAGSPEELKKLTGFYRI